MCNNNMCLKSTTKSADILSISLSDVIIKVPFAPFLLAKKEKIKRK